MSSLLYRSRAETPQAGAPAGRHSDAGVQIDAVEPGPAGPPRAEDGEDLRRVLVARWEGGAKSELPWFPKRWIIVTGEGRGWG